MLVRVELLQAPCWSLTSVESHSGGAKFNTRFACLLFGSSKTHTASNLACVQIISLSSAFHVASGEKKVVSGRRGRRKGSGDRLFMYLLYCLLAWVRELVELSRELLPTVACKEGRDLRSYTGVLFLCCTFTRKCDGSPQVRRWDTDTGGRARDEWGAHFSRCRSFEVVSGRCSICQHGLIHMSNNIFSLFPGQVLFVFLSRRIRIHRCTSSCKDGEAMMEKSKATWPAFLPFILFLVSFF